MKLILIISLELFCQLLLAQSNYRQMRPFNVELTKENFVRVDNLWLWQENNLEKEMFFLNYCFNYISQNSFLKIDSTEYSPCKSEIFAYKSKVFNDKILIWVTEYEFTSNIHLLYIKDNKITNIGRLPVQNTCRECDDRIYPIKKIRITETESNIKFSFLQPAIVNGDEKDSTDNNSKDLNFIFDKSTYKLIKHWR